MKLFYILTAISADLIGFNRLGNDVYNKYYAKIGHENRYDLDVLTFLANSENAKIANFAKLEMAKLQKSTQRARRMYRSRFILY